MCQTLNLEMVFFRMYSKISSEKGGFLFIFDLKSHILTIFLFYSNVAQNTFIFLVVKPHSGNTCLEKTHSTVCFCCQSDWKSVSTRLWQKWYNFTILSQFV